MKTFAKFVESRQFSPHEKAAARTWAMQLSHKQPHLKYMTPNQLLSNAEWSDDELQQNLGSQFHQAFRNGMFIMNPETRKYKFAPELLQ